MAGLDTDISLRDGRTLAYTEHGNLQGWPVLFFHGNPGSRLMRHPDEGIAERLGARVITPDRPGYGRSDFLPKRCLADYPEDLLQLIETLDLKRFSLLGTSAGGPYVAVCAHRFPERIARAAIVSGVAPMDREGAMDDMSPVWRKTFEGARRVPELAISLTVAANSKIAAREPVKSVEAFGKLLSEDDRELLAQPVFRETIAFRRPEAGRQGGKGMAREAKILVSPWGFPLEEISIPIDLWYWQADPAVPMQMARYLESRIPETRSHYFEGGGHLGIFTHWEEILASLVDS